MSIPAHVANHIEAISVGNVDHALNAALLDGHSWSDIGELVSTGFAAVVYTTLPTVPTSSQEAKDAFYKEHQAELALIADAQAEAGTYLEYVLVKTGTAPNFNYAWEKIGSTKTDLSNYVQKGTITLSGSTGQGGAYSGNTGNAGSQTASGTATITYQKATGAASAGEHTHTITPTTTSITYGSAANTGATGVATPATGSAGAHTHEVSTTAHSHTVNLAKDTITYVTGITGGSVGNHSHTYDKGAASLTGTKTFVTSASGTFMTTATVSTLGVLSWNTGSVSTNTGTVGITNSYTSTNSGNAGSHTISATTATFDLVTGATLGTSAPTGTATEAGAHTHSVASIPSHSHSIARTTQTVVTAVSVTGEAGAHTHAVELASATVTGTAAVAVSSHSHSISISSHTHSVSASGNNYA